MAADEGTRPRRADPWVAVAATAFAALGVFFELRGTSRPYPLPDTGGYAIVVLAGVLLSQVRRAPVPVAAALVALCLLYHELGYPGLAPAVVVGVAMYTVTAEGTGLRSLLTAGVLIVAVNVITLLPWWADGLSWGNAGPALGMVAAAAVGEAARSRRVAATEQLRSLRRHAEEDARARLAEQRLGIAREVHDVLAHTVTLIGVQAAAAADALDSRPEDTRAALTAIRGATKEAMAELRGTLVVLRGGDPGSAAPQPGLTQLPDLVQHAMTAGVDVKLTVTGADAGLPATVELVIYRIVQEALTNTIRHSRSSTARVSVEVLAEEIVVTATDEGPPARESETSETAGALGLIGLRERVHALGGTVEAGPCPGSTAFRVAARLPVGPAR